MAGYVGFSKSRNAANAESDGRYPLTKAARVLAKAAKCPIDKAKAFLKKHGTSEWHHTSKFYNTTNYYDVSDEMLPDLIDALSKFVPEPEPAKQTYFKCWNFRSNPDPRKWAWSITTRESASNYSLSEALREVKSRLQTLLASPVPQHKALLRIRIETESALKAMLVAIETATPNPTK